VKSLSSSTSWQELKDFRRKTGDIFSTKTGEGVVEITAREGMDDTELGGIMIAEEVSRRGEDEDISSDDNMGSDDDMGCDLGESDNDDGEYLEGKFPCNLCDYNKAADNKDLRRHKEKLHKERDASLKCTKFWCNQTFNTLYELNVHRKECRFVVCPEDGCSFRMKFNHQEEPHKRMHKRQRDKQV